MPLIETKGAASSQGFGEFAKVGGPPVYIEDVMSVWLYTGNGSTQTINNGIDLAGKGGLVWIKGRSGATNHALYDTARNATKDLVSNSTAAETTQSTGLTSFSSTGFSLGALAKLNTNAATYASWTFRKAEKFFDVVTYTGDGTGTKTINHNLGTTPRFIIIKRTNSTGDWFVSARTTGDTQVELLLNSTAANYSGDVNISSYATSTLLKVGDSQWSAAANGTNINNATYVAYLFAHNAGGFGLTGTDNVISCGSYTGNGSATGPTVSLGYEPQWMMIKNASGTGNWNIFDNMRGLTVSAQNDAYLEANTTDAEASADWVAPNATGFQITTTSSELNTNASTYIYVAIRRGPMKTPTSGTSVFAPVAVTPNGSTTTGQLVTTNFPVDLAWKGFRNTAIGNTLSDRLRGLTAPVATGNPGLYLPSAGNESNTNEFGNADSNTGYRVYGYSTETTVNWSFRRAPGFFDVVCYTGTGSDLTVNHNLGVTPELILTIPRSPSNQFAWGTMTPAGQYSNLRLYSNGALTFSTGITRTSTTYVAPSSLNASVSATKYVTYLFASCPGVSKVGSYTGTGATQTISCGFTGGARFVLIKRTDSTGDWYVWDTARGMTAGTDPSLLLNSTAAEVNANSIYTTTGGFQIVSTAAGINASGGTYIYLAIA